jgi:hypothetical protein
MILESILIHLIIIIVKIIHFLKLDIIKKIVLHIDSMIDFFYFFIIFYYFTQLFSEINNHYFMLRLLKGNSSFIKY